MGGTRFGFRSAAILNFCMKYSEKMKNLKKNTITETKQGQILRYSHEVCKP